MDSREVIRKLKSAGWYEASQVGSHKQFRHPEKKAVSPCRFRRGTYLPGL